MNQIRNERGQVAIFVAFIFQILFVFFAMLVNVGLLIHHKINLQNSADMAAYYGAMKQAEILNAMSHVNYQIRQAWKLLSWRYRILGTFGHRWEPSTPGNGIYPINWILARNTPANLNYARSAEDYHTPMPFQIDPVLLERWYRNPTFCVTHAGYADWPESENLCRITSAYLQNQPTTITLPTPPSVTGGLYGSGASAQVGQAIGIANNIAATRCVEGKYFNYYTLALFAYSFQTDVAIRKATFKKLWNLATNTMSLQATGFDGNAKSSFIDLNGEDVAKGALETLRRNLTEPNRVYLDRVGNATVKMYSGLSDPACEFNQAFTENSIFPHLFYQSSSCTQASGNAGSQLDFRTTHLSETPDTPCNPAATSNGVSAKACQIKDYVYNNSLPDFRMSLGFNRNPKCVPYYGVQVKSTPSIPFMPNAGVTLVAESYTQAFGGSMGPWWGNSFDANQPKSITDPVGPERDLMGPGGALQITATNESTNYAKYPGDIYGLKSNSQLGFYAFELINKVVVPPGPGIHVSDWDRVLGAPGALRFMSMSPVMRNYEIMAIAPDLYDATYYSIDPDFYRNYFVRMTKPTVLGQTISIPQLGSGFLIRPDLGSEPDGSGVYQDFSVANQLQTAETIIANANIPGFPVRDRLAGSLATQANLLTSWNVFRIGDYNQDIAPGSEMWTQKFGRCLKEAGVPTTNDYKANPNTIGNCLSGGRTGFSVRIVSKKYLKDGLGANIQNPLPGW